MHRIAIFSFALAVGACTSTSDPGPDGGPDPSGTVTPRTGSWGYADTTPVSSTCPSSISQGAGNFVIDQSSATSFHIVPGDGTAPFTCTLNGKAFDCPDRAAEMRDYRPAVDAVANLRAKASGTFSSDTRATGRQEATVQCTGTACAAVGTFPCTVKVDFVIQAL